MRHGASLIFKQNQGTRYFRILQRMIIWTMVKGPTTWLVRINLLIMCVDAIHFATLWNDEVIYWDQPPTPNGAKHILCIHRVGC